MKTGIAKLANNLLLVSLPVAIMGALFKILHWPYANQLLIVGIGSVALGSFLKYALEKTFDSYITGATIAIGSIAALFKIMHWPGYSMLSYIAFAGVIILGIRTFLPGKKPTGEN
jgi:hypothetical protein